jgi:hypothetical protein
LLTYQQQKLINNKKNGEKMNFTTIHIDGTLRLTIPFYGNYETSLLTDFEGLIPKEKVVTYDDQNQVHTGRTYAPNVSYRDSITTNIAIEIFSKLKKRYQAIAFLTQPIVCVPLSAVTSTGLIIISGIASPTVIALASITTAVAVLGLLYKIGKNCPETEQTANLSIYETMNLFSKRHSDLAEPTQDYIDNLEKSQDIIVYSSFQYYAKQK